MSVNTKNYFAGESPDTAPNYFGQLQSDLTSELCELCMRFGALHNTLNIVETLQTDNASAANIVAALQLHCITLYWSTQDMLMKYRQHGGQEGLVAEFVKSLRAELRRMQHE